jgi:molybdenum cofactor cytidylyltransferase
LVEPEVRYAGARSVFNPDFQNDEMTVSLKIGLTSIDFKDYSGFFFALGDQPMILTRDLRKLIKSHQKNPGGILFPSYKMRRGHPWFIPSRFVDELKRLTPPETLRTFIKRHESEIEYVVVDNPGILGDIDTPEDYHKLKPKS